MQRLRRRRHPSGCDPSDAKAKRSHSPLRRLFLVVVLVIPRHHHYDGTMVEALVPASTGTFRGAFQKTVLSPLFVATPTISKDHHHLNTYQQRLHRRQQPRRTRTTTTTTSASSASTTALSMVLTTPESIIEQASTVNLLDDLIDESVRTSPRRPIMMQVGTYQQKDACFLSHHQHQHQQEKVAENDCRCCRPSYSKGITHSLSHPTHPLSV